MEIIWDSTDKAIFRDYSKYEAGLLQYGWKGRNWVEYILRKTNKTKRWCLCVGVKRREVQEHCQQSRQEQRGGHLLWQLRSGDGRAPDGEEFSIAPCCRQTKGWMGKKPGKVKEGILDMRVEVKERAVCLEAIKCSGNQQMQPVTP